MPASGQLLSEIDKSSFPQLLSSNFNKHIFQRGAFQVNVFQLNSLLVQPAHHLEERARRTSGIDGQLATITIEAGLHRIRPLWQLDCVQRLRGYDLNARLLAALLL